MEDNTTGYSSPELRDLGTLGDLTLAGEVIGFEDAGPKFALLDVSDGMIP